MHREKQMGCLEVRPFRAEDREAVRRICLQTCEDEFLCQNTEMLYLKYADYFTDEEPEHVFVLVDGEEVCGYILCCAKPAQFRKSWHKTYYRLIRPYGIMQKLLQIHTLLETRIMTGFGYPAHLHIDIDPAHQHMGGGTRLMEALCASLRKEGIRGLYLGCGKENLSANAFYQKFGFHLHHSYGGRNVYTLSLAEQQK